MLEVEVLACCEVANTLIPKVPVKVPVVNLSLF